jgi:hypothetical protein
MPAGRKSKYTPEVVTKIVNALNAGMTDADACAVAGIDDKTFYRWQQQKSEFHEKTTRARQEGWLSDLAVIRRAAIEDRDWRAAAEHLDRSRSPYRKSQETVLTGPEGAPLVIRFLTRPDGPQ